MGNRAVIISDSKRDFGLAVYVHYNGGIDSVGAILKYCKFRKFRCLNNDDYGWARFIQVFANVIGGDLGIGAYSGNHYGEIGLDNGVYVVGYNWDIVDRYKEEITEYDDINKIVVRTTKTRLQEIYEPSAEQMLKDMLMIDRHQPQEDRLGEEKIRKLIEEEFTPKFPEFPRIENREETKTEQREKENINSTKVKITLFEIEK